MTIEKIHNIAQAINQRAKSFQEATSHLVELAGKLESDPEQGRKQAQLNAELENLRAKVALMEDELKDLKRVNAELSATNDHVTEDLKRSVEKRDQIQERLQKYDAILSQTAKVLGVSMFMMRSIPGRVERQVELVAELTRRLNGDPRTFRTYGTSKWLLSELLTRSAAGPEDRGVWANGVVQQLAEHIVDLSRHAKSLEEKNKELWERCDGSYLESLEADAAALRTENKELKQSLATVDALRQNSSKMLDNLQKENLLLQEHMQDVTTQDYVLSRASEILLLAGVSSYVIKSAKDHRLTVHRHNFTADTLAAAVRSSRRHFQAQYRAQGKSAPVEKQTFVIGDRVVVENCPGEGAGASTYKIEGGIVLCLPDDHYVVCDVNGLVYTVKASWGIRKLSD